MQRKVHVKKGDTVMVIAGKDKGKKGKVIKVIPAVSRVMVENVNMVTTHVKQTREMQQAGIIKREAPLHSSNVMLCCTRCNKPTRVGRKILDDGKKVRFCKKCGEVIDK